MKPIKSSSDIHSYLEYTEQQLVKEAQKPISNRLTGIYLLVKNEHIVYAGQTFNFFQRILSHLREKDFDSVVFIPCAPDLIADAELAFIRKFCPNQFCVGDPPPPRKKVNYNHKWGLIYG